MKNIYLVMVFVVARFGYAQSQSFELDPINKKDTINLIDYTGKKQGKWIIFGKTKPNTCYASNPNSKVEEGKYVDNKKAGIWKEFFCNGNMKNKITYANGRPDGYAIMYNENGKISEEGMWKINKWVGDYKLYYENGQVQQEFKFNATGKREGPQKYFYENGQVMIEGNWAAGKEAGVVKEYHENGDIKAEKKYDNGSVDVASIKTFEPKKAIVKVEKPDNSKQVLVAKEETTLDTKTTPKAGAPMVLNGYHVLYNKNKQKSKDGNFKENRLMEGKNYIYDTNGILKRIEIYKNGAYVGDAQIEE
ncbi:MAG TPA: toxin-antitoxin system YwqK family antitoxin [Bacteroidia bacterium]